MVGERRVGAVLESPASWKVPPQSKSLNYELVKDEILGYEVLLHNGPRPLIIKGITDYPSGVEFSCRVRLVTNEKWKRVSFVMNVGKDPSRPGDRGVLISLSAIRRREFCYASARFAHKQFTLNFNLKPYPIIKPAWRDSVRIPIEEAMAQTPGITEKWTTVRCRLYDDRVRVWVDDRLLFDLTQALFEEDRKRWIERTIERLQAIKDKKTRETRLEVFQKSIEETPSLPDSGSVQLTLSAGVRLADFKVRKFAEEGNLFEVIHLDGYVRDRELLGKAGTAVAEDALPFGESVVVKGIPFRFVDRRETGGADHMDLSRSLLRQGLMTGYHQSFKHRFAGTSYVDPARIQLRIPNGRYDAMYFIASFDERKWRIPLLSALFYRPGAGFAKVFETTVPSYRAETAEAIPLSVRLENGRRRKLWLVKMKLDPAELASFSDLEILEVELTKKVYQYRSYPDPYIYGWHQGGLPSGVHIYAVTLHRPELLMTVEPAVFGHVWKAEEKPSYIITLTNRTDKPRTVQLSLGTESYDSKEEHQQERKVFLTPGRTLRQTFTFAVKRFGIHKITVTMNDGKNRWTEWRNLCHLAPDTRPKEWKSGKGPLFGFWSYMGGHYTPPAKEHWRIMSMAGARAMKKSGSPFKPSAWVVFPQWSWAGEEKIDPEKYNACKKKVIERIRTRQGDNPPIVTFFPEPHISRDLATDNLPSYWGEPPYKLYDDERYRLRVFFNTAKAAAEAVRETWPETKILIPWGDPLFIVPLLRAGFPRHLIDGSGLDMVGFERLPEQQLHQMSAHRLYLLKQEYKKFGLKNPFLPYIEGIFVATEPGACTWEEQADYYHRWTLISLAYGITHFFSGWFAFDCGDYYGAEHYGGCGIECRIPYCDPKPAYAHYATMTLMLCEAKFDEWLPTGSLSTYCLKFTRPNGPVYALWTLRGMRPAKLTLQKDTTVTVTDSMGNSRKLSGKEVTVITSPSPIYLSGAEVVSVSLGNPDHSDSVSWSRNRNQMTWYSGPVLRKKPVARTIQIASLGDGGWSVYNERDFVYETNNYDTWRYPGKMSVRIVSDPEHRGLALALRLENQEREAKLMPWYSVLKPKHPIKIPGKAVALGLWVKAHSDWGRVVYSLRDEKGERWISIGAKDQWNCDDLHSWSYFNSDGWRYLRFELPSNAPYDAFREYDTTWWRHTGGDGIVDPPLRLEKIIVERRTHILYVNDIQPADTSDVLLAELIAEYATEFDTTKNAVKLSRIRMELPKPPRKLPNPIFAMQKNPLPPVKLIEVRDPDWGYDGTRCHVHFDHREGAVEYQVWVSAYPDGSGAQAMARMKKSGGLLQGLRPATKFYLWVTYKGEDERQSKPSNRLEIELVDAFAQK